MNFRSYIQGDTGVHNGWVLHQAPGTEHQRSRLDLPGQTVRHEVKRGADGVVEFSRELQGRGTGVLAVWVFLLIVEEYFQQCGKRVKDTMCPVTTKGH